MIKKSNGMLKNVSIIIGIIIGVIIIGTTIMNAISAFGVDNFKVKTTYEEVKNLKPRMNECEKNQKLIQKDIENLTDDTKELKEGQKEILNKLDKALGRRND